MMEENLRLELFSVSEVRDWLLNGRASRGLSEKLIDPCRAWSLIHNPYADDSVYIISAIFVNNELAAYNLGFPDRVFFAPVSQSNPQFVYWNSALYVSPKYEGRGYGAVVIGNLLEQYPNCYFDHAAAPESVENFKFLGLRVDYVPQYIFRPKSIHLNGVKGKLSWVKNKWEEKKRNDRKKKLIKTLSSHDYSLEYTRFVNKETYAFICQHAREDNILHTQESFNWMMQYPFAYQCPLIHRVQHSTVFFSECRQYQLIGLKVFFQTAMVGFYILCFQGNEIVIKYLYYDDKYADIVFASIVEHFLNFDMTRLVTYDKSLRDYILNYRIFAKMDEYPTSFTHSDNYSFDTTLRFHPGEGDMFS